MELRKGLYQKYPYPNIGKVVDGMLYVMEYVDYTLGRRTERVLDVGCGTAEYLMSAAKRNPDIHFIGIDESEAAIKIAKGYKEKMKLGNVELKSMDINSMVVKDEGFDYIVCSGVIEGNDDIGILVMCDGMLKDEGLIGINLRARLGVHEEIVLLKDIVSKIRKNGIKGQTDLHESVELIKKIHESLGEKHWIRKLINKNLLESKTHLMDLLIGGSFSVSDIFSLMYTVGLKFVGFADEHLWIAEFWNLKELVSGLDKKEEYEVIAMIRRDFAYYEFFATNMNCKEKKVECNELMTSPFGTLIESTFVFFDGTTITLDSKRIMMLKYFKKAHTMNEAILELREIEAQVIEDFIRVMFAYKVLI
jgi:2-polyprenyl-3-methyl-5-hydroxy-6-metoxy-1,4-benzoquinol methylase